jgi:hypothetical protein
LTLFAARAGEDPFRAALDQTREALSLGQVEEMEAQDKFLQVILAYSAGGTFGHGSHPEVRVQILEWLKDEGLLSVTELTEAVLVPFAVPSDAEGWQDVLGEFHTLGVETEGLVANDLPLPRPHAAGPARLSDYGLAAHHVYWFARGDGFQSVPFAELPEIVGRQLVQMVKGPLAKPLIADRWRASSVLSREDAYGHVRVLATGREAELRYHSDRVADQAEWEAIRRALISLIGGRSQSLDWPDLSQEFGLPQVERHIVETLAAYQPRRTAIGEWATEAEEFAQACATQQVIDVEQASAHGRAQAEKALAQVRQALRPEQLATDVPANTLKGWITAHGGVRGDRRGLISWGETAAVRQRKSREAAKSIREQLAEAEERLAQLKAEATPRSLFEKFWWCVRDLFGLFPRRSRTDLLVQAAEVDRCKARLAQVEAEGAFYGAFVKRITLPDESGKTPEEALSSLEAHIWDVEREARQQAARLRDLPSVSTVYCVEKPDSFLREFPPLKDLDTFLRPLWEQSCALFQPGSGTDLPSALSETPAEVARQLQETARQRGLFREVRDRSLWEALQREKPEVEAQEEALVSVRECHLGRVPVRSGWARDRRHRPERLYYVGVPEDSFDAFHAFNNERRIFPEDRLIKIPSSERGVVVLEHWLGIAVHAVQGLEVAQRTYDRLPPEEQRRLWPHPTMMEWPHYRPTLPDITQELSPEQLLLLADAHGLLAVENNHLCLHDASLETLVPLGPDQTAAAATLGQNGYRDALEDQLVQVEIGLGREELQERIKVYAAAHPDQAAEVLDLAHQRYPVLKG